MFGFRRRGAAGTDSGQQAAAPAGGAAQVAVLSPVAGTLVPLADVPDPVFSGGLVGPGFAVDPASGEFHAPISGTVTMLPETLHAVGIRHDSGAEVLVHVGVDSVTLKGAGFTALCEQGQRIEAGDPILRVDLEQVRAQIPSVLTPVIITSADGFTLLGPDLGAPAGSAVMTLRPE